MPSREDIFTQIRQALSPWVQVAGREGHAPIRSIPAAIIRPGGPGEEITLLLP